MIVLLKARLIQKESKRQNLTSLEPSSFNMSKNLLTTGIYVMRTVLAFITQ